MKIRVALRQAMLAVTLALGAPLMAQDGGVPPLSAYGELPAIDDIVLSPNGERMAMVTTEGKQRFLKVVTADGKVLSRMGVDGIKIRRITFVTDDLLMLQRSTTENLGFGFTQDKFEFYQALLISLAQNNVELVFAKNRELVNAVFGYYGMRTVGGSPKAYFGAIELSRNSMVSGGATLSTMGGPACTKSTC